MLLHIYRHNVSSGTMCVAGHLYDIIHAVLGEYMIGNNDRTYVSRKLHKKNAMFHSLFSTSNTWDRKD